MSDNLIQQKPKTQDKDPEQNLANKSEKKQTMKDKLEAIFQKIDKGVQEVFTSKRFVQALKTFAKFHRYSWRNALLIEQQCPKASYVAGYSAWKNKFERQVNKGQKGIQILGCREVTVNDEPSESESKDSEGKTKTVLVFYPTYVWDVSQTSGKPLPEIAPTLLGEVDGYRTILEALIQTAPCEVRFEPFSEREGKGYYRRPTELSGAEIVIKENMSEAQTVKTLIHEMGHATLHSETRQLDRQTREVQAESVAFIVCEHLNIDSSEYSFPYIAAWSDGRELSELKQSLEDIKAASSQIIHKFEKHLELEKAKAFVKNDRSYER